jgi:glycosyltransferase involved in cell wall biosynthesis
MKSYLQSVGDRILKQADHVISFTERENQLVLNHGIPRSKTSVIPTGVDTKLFTQRRESSTTPTVLWVGRFVPEKGLNTLLNAAKLVTTKMPHVKFVLIGYGPLYGWLLDLRTKLRLEKSVEFVQPVPHERLVDYLSRATVFALPSLNEGLPSTILEAMSCSRPVVVTKGIGLDDVVKDAGALFPLGDSDQLAETLLDIINDGSKSRLLGAAARKRALQFDWSSISRQTSELFESIIEAYHR